MAGNDFTRQCKACGDIKPLSEFHPNPHKNYKCSACLREYKRQHYLANRELVIARVRANYRTDIDRSRAISRERAKNDPKAGARKVAYKVRHRDRVLMQAKEYREKNKEACNARIAAWGERNKHVRAFYAQNRRAALLKATPSWADADAMLAIFERARELGMEVDHIVPLQGKTVCGLHCEANLQLLPLKANRAKGNRYWPDMDVSAL